MGSLDQPTNAQVAERLVAALPPGVFGRAAEAAAMHADFTLLERMLPGITFGIIKSGPDTWELAGRCRDGSTVIWTLGG